MQGWAPPGGAMQGWATSGWARAGGRAILAGMCGRYTQTRTWSELVDLYRISEVPDADLRPTPRYNIAPTQTVPVVRPATKDSAGGDAAAGDDAAGGSTPKDGTFVGGRALAMLRWGLVPFWAKDPTIGSRLINARAESIAEKPSFRDAFRKRRCLVLADGFYEWQTQPQGPKQPFYITTPATVAFAGLWERWRDPAGPVLETCSIVTTEASDQLRPIHDRMPVILAAEAFDAWLDARAPLAAALLVPYRQALTVYPVARRVNAVRHDDPACIAPAA